MLDRYNVAGAGAAAMGRYGASLGSDEDEGGEKIGIARITLKQHQHGVSALVSGFFEADRLLSAWKGQARKAVDCELLCCLPMAHQSAACCQYGPGRAPGRRCGRTFGKPCA